MDKPGKERVSIHMPPDWSDEKRDKFLAWLNDELEAEGAPLIQLPRNDAPTTHDHSPATDKQED